MTGPSIQLTPVETRMLTFLADGHTHPAIAREIGITKRAVAMALSRMYQRIGARNGASAVAIVIRAGLLPSEGRRG